MTGVDLSSRSIKLSRWDHIPHLHPHLDVYCVSSCSWETKRDEQVIGVSFTSKTQPSCASPTSFLTAHSLWGSIQSADPSPHCLPVHPVDILAQSPLLPSGSDQQGNHPQPPAPLFIVRNPIITRAPITSQSSFMNPHSTSLSDPFKRLYRITSTRSLPLPFTLTLPQTPPSHLPPRPIETIPPLAGSFSTP